MCVFNVCSKYYAEKHMFIFKNIEKKLTMFWSQHTTQKSSQHAKKIKVEKNQSQKNGWLVWNLWVANGNTKNINYNKNNKNQSSFGSQNTTQDSSRHAKRINSIFQNKLNVNKSMAMFDTFLSWNDERTTYKLSCGHRSQNTEIITTSENTTLDGQRTLLQSHTC